MEDLGTLFNCFIVAVLYTHQHMLHIHFWQDASAVEQYMDIPCPCWKASGRISDGEDAGGKS